VDGEAAALARVPPADQREDWYIQRQLQNCRTPRLTLTADTSAIHIITDPTITNAMRGYLVQSAASRVRYSEEQRARTSFEFAGSHLTGELTWDRLVFVEQLCQRLGVSVDTSRHRTALGNPSRPLTSPPPPSPPPGMTPLRPPQQAASQSAPTPVDSHSQRAAAPAQAGPSGGEPLGEQRERGERGGRNRKRTRDGDAAAEPISAAASAVSAEEAVRQERAALVAGLSGEPKRYALRILEHLANARSRLLDTVEESRGNNSAEATLGSLERVTRSASGWLRALADDIEHAERALRRDRELADAKHARHDSRQGQHGSAATHTGSSTRDSSGSKGNGRGGKGSKRGGKGSGKGGKGSGRKGGRGRF
jgi:hypothetical protein